MIGLTATPASFIKRNTFLEFDCPDNIPTFLYSYQEAIDDGYLVDYDLYIAQTKLQRKGIKGVDLTEEECNALVEQGCNQDEYGQLPGKTIVFAMTQDHALRLAETFEEMFSQYPGLVEVITYKSEYKGRLIERFKKENLPRITIPVDMLETGVNVPEAVNPVSARGCSPFFCKNAAWNWQTFMIHP